MAVVHASVSDFKKLVLENTKPVIVDFFAEWCGPCKMMAPVLDQISEESKAFDIVKVDVDASSDLAAQYQVSSIPTFVLFQKGQPVGQAVGAIGKSGILALAAKAQ